MLSMFATYAGRSNGASGHIILLSEHCADTGIDIAHPTISTRSGRRGSGHPTVRRPIITARAPASLEGSATFGGAVGRRPGPRASRRSRPSRLRAVAPSARTR